MGDLEVVRSVQDTPTAMFISPLFLMLCPFYEGLCNHKSESVIVS